MAAFLEIEMDNAQSTTDTIAENPSFKQLAFIIGVVLLLGAWKFGIEGILE